MANIRGLALAAAGDCGSPALMEPPAAAASGAGDHTAALPGVELTYETLSV